MHDQPHGFKLMEDGVLVHCWKFLETWREAHGMKKLDWLPNFPYLNPIENL